MFAKGLDKNANLKKIPTDPRSIVEAYLCDDSNKSCMLGECNDCENHGLAVDDFVDGSDDDSSDESEGSSSCDEEVRIKFYQWKKKVYLSKMLVTVDVNDALSMWQNHVTVMKRYIFTKRQQHEAYNNIKQNLTSYEIMIHLDYSENYKSSQQNEIQSAYFGNVLFSLFTACTYYRQISDGTLAKIMMTIRRQLNMSAHQYPTLLNEFIFFQMDVRHNFGQDLYSLCCP